jgi:exonuclease VII large subunit
VRSRLGDPRAFLIPLEQRLDDAERRLGDSGRAAVRVREERLRGALRRLAAHDPSQRLAARAQRLQAAAMRLESAIAGRYGAELRRAREAGRRLEPAARMRLERARGGLEIANAHLNGKDPEAILQRGYAIVTYRNAIVRDPEAIPAGALIEARVARGTLAARVETEGADGNKHGG